MSFWLNIYKKVRGNGTIFQIISYLCTQKNEMLVAAINRHWEFINEQVTRAFNGEKTVSIDIEK